jgi:hypothetical protein
MVHWETVDCKGKWVAQALTRRLPIVRLLKYARSLADKGEKETAERIAVHEDS